MQSAAEQHVPTVTHVPSEHAFWLVVVRFVSQPSVSGGAELQSPQPAAQPVYVQPPGPQAAPWLWPDVVSHAAPHAVQLLTVFSGWQRPAQHPLPAGHPCDGSQPVTHISFEQVSPRGQLESVTQPTQVWFVVSQTVPPPVPPSAPASASAVQSRLVLHPGAQAVPAQYWPVGQLSLDGKHCTQVSFVVSHHGVAPWHWELTRHCTHAPALHT